MNDSLLTRLGKISGLPGIAIGAVILLLAPVIEVLNILPEVWRGPVVVTVVVFGSLVIIFVLIGWMRGEGKPSLREQKKEIGSLRLRNDLDRQERLRQHEAHMAALTTIKMMESKPPAVDLEAVNNALKLLIELIQKISIVPSVDGPAKDDDLADFWLGDVMDPLHSAMCAVHKIYLDTFTMAKEKLATKDTPVTNVIQFLADRQRETTMIRADLAALREQVRQQEGAPNAVFRYMTCLNYYFDDPMSLGVSTPMRGLLGRLRNLEYKGVNVSSAQMDKMLPEYLQGNLREQAAHAVSGYLQKINDLWPETLEAYHGARLELRRKAPVRIKQNSKRKQA